MRREIGNKGIKRVNRVRERRDMWYKGEDGSSVVVSPGEETGYTAQAAVTPTDGRTVMNGLPTSLEYGAEGAVGGGSNGDSSSNSNNNTSSNTHSLGPHSPSASSSSALTAGPIVGIVVGVVAFTLIVLLVLGKWRRRASRRRVDAYARAAGIARTQPHWRGVSKSGKGTSELPTTAVVRGEAEAEAVKSQHSRSYSEAAGESSLQHTQHTRRTSTSSSLIPSETEKNSVAAASWFRGSGGTTTNTANTHTSNASMSDAVHVTRSDSDTSRFRRARNSFGSPLDMLSRSSSGSSSSQSSALSGS
ncbi:hypothetical protein E3P89_01934 [Wallemia ichthyophaga]|nr:hypothetical protein E3P93_02535 [Wallemia ichthyophaga]TIB22722.1 hypothetical protein E3P89_01934 [Wallemia ichthyophaga]TIB24140.1 hypothetical protein E3P88_02183 [Wallemia ichthyophaga]